MGAVSALYDKFLLRFYEPLEVQAWYSFYQLLIMGATIAVLLKVKGSSVPFRWSWAIPFIAGMANRHIIVDHELHECQATRHYAHASCDEE